MIGEVGQRLAFGTLDLLKFVDFRTCAVTGTTDTISYSDSEKKITSESAAAMGAKRSWMASSIPTDPLSRRRGDTRPALEATTGVNLIVDDTPDDSDGAAVAAATAALSQPVALAPLRRRTRPDRPDVVLFEPARTPSGPAGTLRLLDPAADKALYLSLISQPRTPLHFLPDGLDLFNVPGGVLWAEQDDIREVVRYALEKAGLSETDVELINVPTNETPQVLASGDVDAIVAWQPNSGMALNLVPGDDGTGDFYFPSYAEKDLGNPVLGGGTLMAITDPSDATSAIMEFFQLPLAHEVFGAQSGFLTPHKGVNPETYLNDALRGQADILVNATTFRFDGSDLMPGGVGAGTFWTGMVDYTGGKAAQQVADEIQASWDALK